MCWWNCWKVIFYIIIVLIEGFLIIFRESWKYFNIGVSLNIWWGKEMVGLVIWVVLMWLIWKYVIVKVIVLIKVF